MKYSGFNPFRDIKASGFSVVPMRKRLTESRPGVIRRQTVTIFNGMITWDREQSIYKLWTVTGHDGNSVFCVPAGHYPVKFRRGQIHFDERFCLTSVDGSGAAATWTWSRNNYALINIVDDKILWAQSRGPYVNQSQLTIEFKGEDDDKCI